MENKRSPFAWLWNNEQLADVSFSIRFRTAHTPLDTQGLHGLHLQDNASLSGSIPHPAQTSENVTGTSNAKLPSGVWNGSLHGGLATTPGACKPDTDNTFIKVYYLHSQLVCSASAFFRASVTTEVGNPSSKEARTDKACQWQLRAEMCANEADAVEAVLLSLYMPQEYDQGTDSELLLQILKVADLWQADETAAAASKALCCRIDSFPLCSVYSLPEGLAVSETFHNLFAVAKRILFNRFGNARTVIDTPRLLLCFLDLPFTALYTLLHSAELVADAEASVLLLFSGWCEGAAGMACSEEQLQQLNAGIRYSRLSNPYLTELCHNLHSPRLTHKQLMELWHFRSIPRHLNPHKICDLEGPPGWYLPQRPASPAHPLNFTLDLAVTEADLKVFLAVAADATSADISRSSAAVYSAGFLWTLTLSAKRGELWCGVSAQGVGSVSAPRQGTPLKHGIMRGVRLWVESALNMEVMEMESGHMSGVLYGKDLTWVSQTGDTLDSRCLEWWAPHMVDGCILFTAEIVAE